MMISFMCPVNMFLQKNECFKSIFYILFMARTIPYIAKTLLSSCLYNDTNPFVSHTYNHIAQVPNNGQYSVPPGDVHRSIKVPSSRYKHIYKANSYSNWMTLLLHNEHEQVWLYTNLSLCPVSPSLLLLTVEFSISPQLYGLYTFAVTIYRWQKMREDCDKATFV